MKNSAIFTLAAIAMTMNLNALTPNPNEMALDNNRHDAAFMTTLNTAGETETAVTDWMFDVNAFETEPAMAGIEPWMLDVNAFSEPVTTAEDWLNFDALDEEYEETIELEAWMFDVDHFMDEEDFEEEMIEIEEWMFDVDAF